MRKVEDILGSVKSSSDVRSRLAELAVLAESTSLADRTETIHEMLVVAAGAVLDFACLEFPKADTDQATRVASSLMQYICRTRSPA